MGAEEAIRILMNMLKELAHHFDPEDYDLMIASCVKALVLCCKERNEQEERDYEAIKIALEQCGNKIKLALINEGRSYTTIGKVIRVIIG